MVRRSDLHCFAQRLGTHTANAIERLADAPLMLRVFVVACIVACIAAAQQVATLRVQEPAPIVHGTVPFDRGTQWKSQSCPFVVVAPDGTHCRTQFEIVATWPDGSVRVGEILACVPTAIGPQVYSIVRELQRVERSKPGAWAEAWISTAPKLLLDARPPPIAWSRGYFRSGAVATTRRFHDRNLFGWVTTYHGLDVVTLDVVLHDGHPGSPDLLFDALELHDFADGSVSGEVAWPNPGVANTGASVRLVAPRADGRVHGLVQRGAHWWSLVLHDGTQAALARRMADGAGWGTCDAWTRVDAYGCVALRLPDLAYRESALRADARAAWSAISNALANGTPFGLFGSGAAADGPGRLDWQHAYAPMDGGSTGGGKRDQWYGLDGIFTADPQARATWQATLSMIMDRHACAITRDDGSPIVLDEWCDASGRPLGNWRASSADARFDGATDGAFGFAAVQALPVGAAIAPELASFKQKIAGGGNSSAYEPIDYQHWDRALEDAEALAFLDNSPVAIWWLRMNAETWRMSQYSVGRLQGEWLSATANPGHGSWMGREHGHAYRFAALAFALSDQAWRTRWDSYFQRFGDALVAAQMPSGIYQARIRKEAKAAPFGDGTTAQWWIAKGTEESLLCAALIGAARSTRVANPESLVLSADRWTRDGLWRFLWHSGATGIAPTNFIGVCRVVGGGKGAIEADAAAVPRSGADGEELTSPLGAAMLLRVLDGQPLATEQVSAALKWCGNTNTLAGAAAWAKSKSNYQLKVNDCAPMLAAIDFELNN